MGRARIAGLLMSGGVICVLVAHFNASDLGFFTGVAFTIFAGILYHTSAPRIIEIKTEVPVTLVHTPTDIAPLTVTHVAAWPPSQLVAALDDFKRSLTDTQDDMSFANQLAKESGDSVKSSTDCMRASVSVFGDLETYMKQIGPVFSELSSQSVRIGAIVSNIQDIARQTNLLALNASIEAARAGEHGKGFAVVADEVRNLSKRAADSSAQIRHIAEGLEQTASEARNGVEKLSGSTRLGVEKTEVALESMQRLRSGAVERMKIVERVMARLKELQGLASNATNLLK